jgi:hypothetical protein
MRRFAPKWGYHPALRTVLVLKTPRLGAMLP